MIVSSPIDDSVFPKESYPHWRSHLVLPLLVQMFRTFSLVWDLMYSQWDSDCLRFFLMNCAEFIVAPINIPHIIECSSPSSATLERFSMTLWLSSGCCEGVRVVMGDESLLGGVAQVVLHGDRVVEVSLQVKEHEGGEKGRRSAGGS